ncbi:MAG: heparinase II/III family protein [Victivallales bacterium]
MRISSQWVAAACAAGAICFSSSISLFADAPVESIGESPLPAGTHPRLLFSKGDLPAIRARAETTVGKELVKNLRGSAFAGNIIEELKKMNPAWLEECRKQWSGFRPQLRQAALLYQITGDKEDGRMALEMFRIWMSGFPPDGELKAEENWGDMESALAYDWLYELLNDEERGRSRRILASMVGKPSLDMYASSWWLDGPMANGRNCTNWTCLCAIGQLFCDLAIEGEDGYFPPTAAAAAAKLREFLDNGISAEGAMTEGIQYPMNFGTHTLPHALIMLRRRGVDMITTTNLPRVPEWLAYEALPWGYEGFDYNKSNGEFQSAAFASFIGKELGPMGRWVYQNSVKAGLGVLPDTTVALINGWPEEKAGDRSALPPGRWFADRGLVFCRNGWGVDDAVFFFNTSPLRAGHTHADQGSFCLASNGTCFIADSGYGNYSSRDHNIVHIDGKAQEQIEGGSDAFIRSVDFSSYADILDSDLKLAYDRVLDGDIIGPWHWRPYNPVRQADRRCLFLRGASGPVVLVADDLRADDQEHEYDWLARTVAGNTLRVDGRRFTIQERFGGKVLRSMTNGAAMAWRADRVAGGVYHGWALVRGEPFVQSWCSNTFVVNGISVAAAFGRGAYRQGWNWLPILPGGKAEITIADGSPLRFELICGSGGRVAAAVFTRDQTWTPGDDLPVSGDPFIVFTAEDAGPADANRPPWEKIDTRRGILDGVFLGNQNVKLNVDRAKTTGYPVLHAVQRGINGRFLSLLAPHSENDGRSIELPRDGDGQMALVRSAAGVDLVGGSVNGVPVKGELQTDASMASVSFLSRNQSVPIGYAAVNGSLLICRGIEYVRSGNGVFHVSNDGTDLVVRGTPGAVARCLRLGATQLVRNGVRSPLPSGEVVTISIPSLPAKWEVSISPDGRRVDVTGDGPLPLRVEAAKAVQLTVNGIGRYFVRPEKNSPFLQAVLWNGSDLYRYRDELSASELLPAMKQTKAVKMVEASSLDPKLPKTKVLVSEDGVFEMSLTPPGPGKYRLVVETFVSGAQTVEAQISISGKSVAGIRSEPGRLNTARTDVVIKESPCPFMIKGPAVLALAGLRLEPVYRDLPAPAWRFIGPFKSGFAPGGKEAEAVRAAMSTVYGPEKEINFEAVYKGMDDKDLKWDNRDDTSAPYMQSGLNFTHILKLPRGGVCFAVTFINSPDDRSSQLVLSCDWWANAYINGELVDSERAASQVQQDGASFTSTNATCARIRLKKGVNTLLVKCHGGSGGSRFAAQIIDPGDLGYSASKDKFPEQKH